MKEAVKNGVDLIISGAGLPVDLPGLVQGSKTKIAPIISSLKSAKVLCKMWDRDVYKRQVAGGTEAAITPVGLGGFAALTALSTSTDPQRCSIPFDKERDGFVMGEGAGVVILEELEHAKKRGANILAEDVYKRQVSV